MTIRTTGPITNRYGATVRAFCIDNDPRAFELHTNTKTGDTALLVDGEYYAIGTIDTATGRPFWSFSARGIETGHHEPEIAAAALIVATNQYQAA